jgi:hypothetical protein
MNSPSDGKQPEYPATFQPTVAGAVPGILDSGDHELDIARKRLGSTISKTDVT